LTVIGTYLPNETRGLAYGAFLAVGRLVGFGVAPTALIGVSIPLGAETHLAPALAMVGVAVSLIAFVSFGLAMRNVPPLAGENTAKRGSPVSRAPG
jgi:hypothetical protein